MTGGDFFCGTVRRFIRVYRFNDPSVPIEQLGELQQLKSEIAG
jgi:hypothetical protein